MTRDPGASETLEALSWRGWVALQDRTLPGRGGRVIDHVLVGPGGVFVLARKRWAGPVEVVDGELRLAGRAERSDINAVSEAAAAVLALVPGVPVQPVLCVERHAPLTGWVRNVLLCGSSNVEEILTTRPPALGPSQVREVAGVLESKLPAVVVPVVEQARTKRDAAPWPVRMLLQAVTMATAAVLVIAALETGLVTQLSTVVGDFVSGVASVDEQPRRNPEQKPEQKQPEAPPDARPPGAVGGKDRAEKAPKAKGAKSKDTLPRADRGQKSKGQKSKGQKSQGQKSQGQKSQGQKSQGQSADRAKGARGRDKRSEGSTPQPAKSHSSKSHSSESNPSKSQGRPQG